ncbi:unnamed protein product [Cuscuta campestris]|uniref:WPP domain-containing protein n=1 Tax=Cuscuta campestris TaxID=132261 RepID=A0A484LZY2_9ASTE|nr:unnamed protein product [Cuscuta campestris]
MPDNIRHLEVEAPEKRESASDASRNPMDFSFSIWPPGQRTRGAVVNRLIQTLTGTSVLTERYGTIPPEEGPALSRAIEKEAFNAAAAAATPGDEGIQILQAYSKEVSKRLLDAVKSRPASAVPDNKTSVVGKEIAAAADQEVSDVTMGF